MARSCYLVNVSDEGSNPASTEVRRRSDGEETHAAILDAAMRLASVEGLGSLSIGRLANETGISKSGVFAHFRSKERLQHETIAAAEAVFAREVIEPGLDAEVGLAQVEALCEAYLSYLERGVFPGGCFFAQLLAEFDAPEGSVHDAVLVGQRGWVGMLEGLIAIAQRQGEIEADVDPAQLAFELYAALELASYLSTLLRDPALVERGRIAVGHAIERCRPGRSGLAGGVDHPGDAEAVETGTEAG
jgi:AcrR family transcriptional regulator